MVIGLIISIGRRATTWMVGKAVGERGCLSELGEDPSAEEIHDGN
jgi:hypothetical protein